MENLDFHLPTVAVFKNFSEIVTNFENLKISKEIYFKPSNFPHLTRFDIRKGSCFKDLIFPSSSFRYYNNQFLILAKTLNLNDYKNFLYHEILKLIKDCYNESDDVVFLYSGGIDSIVVLSFLFKLNLLSKTKIVTVLDATQDSSSALVNDKVNQEKIYDLKKFLKNKIKSFDIVNLDKNTIIDVFNNGNYYDLVCHVSSYIMNLYNNNKFINGGHGNESLLHQRNNIHEILKIYPNKINDVDHQGNYYCTKYSSVTLEEELIGVEHKELIAKPWHKISFKNKKFFTPLGSEKIFLQLRRLDYSNISVNYLENVDMAREFINLNCNNLLDNFISHESLTDGDNISQCKVPTKNINRSLLTIPKNLNHNKEGLDFLEWEISKIDNNEDIDFNSLISIKMIQQLEKEFQ